MAVLSNRVPVWKSVGWQRCKVCVPNWKTNSILCMCCLAGVNVPAANGYSMCK